MGKKVHGEEYKDCAWAGSVVKSYLGLAPTLYLPPGSGGPFVIPHIPMIVTPAFMS